MHCKNDSERHVALQVLHRSDWKLSQRHHCQAAASDLTTQNLDFGTAPSKMDMRIMVCIFGILRWAQTNLSC